MGLYSHWARLASVFFLEKQGPDLFAERGYSHSATTARPTQTRR